MAPSAVSENMSDLPQKPVLGSKNEGLPIAKIQDVQKTDFVVRTFRCLIADLCEQFRGGHPG